MIANKYEIIKNIGSGAFGGIYKGKNTRTGEYVAIKVEPINKETNILKNEARIYQYLKGGVGIPNVKWFGVDNTNNYMVINLLGDTLEQRRASGGPFSPLLDTISKGKQMIERIEYIHNNGLVHRDIKPDNFLFGLGDKSNMLYLIDFGFCKKYNRSENVKSISSVIGTPKYISINVHNLKEPGIKDDLESILYVMMYLYYRHLPWDISNMPNNEISKIKYEIIYNEKGNIESFFRSYINILKSNMNIASIYQLIYNLLNENIV